MTSFVGSRALRWVSLALPVFPFDPLLGCSKKEAPPEELPGLHLDEASR